MTRTSTRRPVKTGLKAEPKHPLSGAFLISEADRQLTELKPALLGEKAEFVVDGVEYQLGRESLIGDFTLSSGQRVLARATKAGVFSSTFTIALGDSHYELRRKLGAARFVLEQGGKQVGHITQVGIFTRKTEIELPEEWPLPVRVFTFWLVQVIWNRDTA